MNANVGILTSLLIDYRNPHQRTSLHVLVKLIIAR
jgi:hypothetical protein